MPSIKKYKQEKYQSCMSLLAGKEYSFPILFAVYTVRYRSCPYTLRHIYRAAGCTGQSNRTVSSIAPNGSFSACSREPGI